jgi:tRNA A37 methylthiotransferase MiaB
MSHEINQGYVGRTLEVLIEGTDSKRVNVLARTGQNKIVVLPPHESEPGSFREARIDRAEGQTLYGTLLATA